MEESPKEDDVIDCSNKHIAQIADSLFQKAGSKTEYIHAAYESVSRQVSHIPQIHLEKHPSIR